METETRLRSAFWVTWFCPAHLPQSMREFFFAATTAPEMPCEGEEENEKMEGERDEEGFSKREEGRSSRLRQQAPVAHFPSIGRRSGLGGRGGVCAFRY